MDLIIQPPINMEELRPRIQAGELAYIRIDVRQPDGRLNKVGAFDWTEQGVAAKGVKWPGPEDNPVRALEEATRHEIGLSVVSGRTAELRIRAFGPKGQEVYKTYTVRATRTAGDDDLPPPADETASARGLAEADVLLATPAIKTWVDLAPATTRVLQTTLDVSHSQMVRQQEHMERMISRQEERHAAEVSRMQTAWDADRAASAATIAALSSDIESMRKQIITLAEMAADDRPKQLDFDKAGPLIEKMQSALKPFAALAPDQLKAVFNHLPGGAAASDAAPGAALLAKLMAAVPADKIDKIDVAAILARLEDRATIDTILSALGV